MYKLKLCTEIHQIQTFYSDKNHLFSFDLRTGERALSLLTEALLAGSSESVRLTRNS